MKHHDGKKKINKVDGGKRKARKQYHKAIRKNAKTEIKEQGVPMSINSPMDNAMAWLEDEPWRM